MKKFATALIAAACLAAPAFADGMSNTFGNTVRVTAGEQSFDAQFDADGSYSDSRDISGNWTFGDQLCVTVNTEEGPMSNCGPWNEDLGVGETWSTDGWSQDGTVLTIEIIAGR